jgi:hypothetical protein
MKQQMEVKNPCILLAIKKKIWQNWSMVKVAYACQKWDKVRLQYAIKG